MKNLKKITILFFIITTIIVLFTSKYNSLIKEFEITGKSKEAGLNDDIQLCSNFIESVTIYGNNFLKQGTIKDSDIYSILKYDPISNTYNLDAVGGTKYERTIGNLTGIGNIPEGVINKDEVNLALHYNEFFSKFYTRLPNIAWLYYTSENNFTNIYPWTPSKEFALKDNIKSSEFFEYANPKNNPLRKAVWTPVYLDSRGKSLVVTLSSPIYYNDTFKGVVSVDLTTNSLKEVITSKYDSYLIDDVNSIIATSKNIKFHEEVIKLNTLLKIPKSDIDNMKEIKDNSVQRVGKYYIYKSSFNNTTWNMLLLVPVSLIIGKSILFTLPTLIICILLFLTVNEIEIRKKTEEVLKKTAITDQLTGLNNRHFFDEKFLEEMYRSDRYDRPLSMIIFDLDHFKHINDTWGHPIGDEVLKQTAEITGSLIRNTDMIFRFGGEEFVILLPETTISDAHAVAEKLRNALDRNIHPVIGRFTASFGVGERSKNESFKIWYQKVDNALYSAKNEGRNLVVDSLDLEVSNVATVYIEWKNEWSSGNNIIDQQHQKLIEMTNELLDMSFSIMYSEKIISHFDILLECLINHFAYEEKLIFNSGYPDFDKHVKEHKQLCEKALQFKKTCQRGQLKYSDCFEILVDDIIIGHIINEDTKYFSYIGNI